SPHFAIIPPGTTLDAHPALNRPATDMAKCHFPTYIHHKCLAPESRRKRTFTRQYHGRSEGHVTQTAHPAASDPQTPPLHLVTDLARKAARARLQGRPAHRTTGPEPTIDNLLTHQPGARRAQ